jgi:hypothetical protein
MKEKQIVFRVSEDEYDEITLKSKKFRFRSVSEYCRLVALTTNNINIKEESKTLEEPFEKYTTQEICEMASCASSIPRFFDKCKVFTPHDGMVDFKLKDHQYNWIQEFEKSGKNVFLMANTRQCGATATISTYLLHKALYSLTPVTIGMYAYTASMAVRTLADIKERHESLPPHLQNTIKTYNKTSIVFENGSEILCGAMSQCSMRGRGYNYIFFDQFSFVKNNKEIYDSIAPIIQCNQNAKLIITGRPSNDPHAVFGFPAQDCFPALWRNSKQANGPSRICSMSTNWDVIEGRDQAWKDDTIKMIGEEAFMRDYEVSISLDLQK